MGFTGIEWDLVGIRWEYNGDSGNIVGKPLAGEYGYA